MRRRRRCEMPTLTRRSATPLARRLIAGSGLAIVLTSGAAAAASPVPYSVSDLGAAPEAGFRISDIGAVPSSPTTTSHPDPAPAVEFTISDIGPVSSAEPATGAGTPGSHPG